MKNSRFSDRLKAKGAEDEARKPDQEPENERVAFSGGIGAAGVRDEAVYLQLGIQTYKEIVAFTDGKSLTKIEKAIEKGKWPYQRAPLAAGSGLLVVVVALILSCIMRIIF